MFEIIKSLDFLNFFENEKNNIKNNLVNILFKEIPNLRKFEFKVSNEYNDNNYYTYVGTSSVNDIPVQNYEYEHVDEEGVVWVEDIGFTKANEKDLLNKQQLFLLCRVVDEIGKDYGDSEHTTIERPTNIKISDFKIDHDWRNVYKEIINQNNKEFKGESPISSLYYAISKGQRLTESQEECFKDKYHGIQYAYYYAKYVIKGKLPKELHNYFCLSNFKNNTEKSDYYSEVGKYYLDLYMSEFK